MEVFASDGEWSDSELSSLCKLQSKDYQYVLNGSLDLIDTVNQTLAHKTRHSHQFNNNSENNGEFFGKNYAAFATDLQNFVHCTIEGTFDIFVQWYQSSFLYFA